jgi:hypothetical protein
MFVRKLTFSLKPNMRAQFISTVETQINPVLRKQQGFKDQMAFAAPGSSDVEVVALWDSQADAENYARTTSSEVFKMFANFIESAPKVETLEVLYSTFPETAAGKKTAA